MKLKFLTLLIFIFKLGTSQEYPVSSIDTNNNHLIVFNEQQAQLILKELNTCDLYKELVELMSTENTLLMSSEVVYKKIINEKDNIILEKDSIISNNEITIKTQTEKINNVETRLTNCEKVIELSNKEIENKDEEIEIKKDAIKKWKLISAGSWVIIIALILI